jgi:hypothetical protein
MNYKLELINPAFYPGWNELILDNKNYSIFHSREWCEVLHKTYRYEPQYFINFNKGKPEALLPMMLVKSALTGKRLVSLPFSDYCEPLIENENEYNDLLKKVIDLCEQYELKYVELRGGTSFLTDQSIYSNGYLHELDLNLGEKDLLENLRSSNKRNIKKATKEGIEVKFTNEFRSIIDFYNLNILTRKRHGLPPQPLMFFRNIGDILLPSGFCEIAESIYKGRVIASCVFLTFGKKVLYKFGASDYNFQNLRANDLLFWEAIKRYSHLGYEKFCFGRTSAENESLRHFKMGWGVREIPSHYYRYNIKINKFESSGKFSFDSPGEVGLYNYIFKHAPKFVLKMIGNIAYRHIG